MDIEIRHPKEDEFEFFLRRTEMAFGEDLREGEADRFRPLLQIDRMHMAVDGDQVVGTAADYAFSLTVPGGKVAAAGVTMVGVLPSHRRRGILTRMMARQLDTVARRGEPLAVLWASEGDIYQRFGYGIATFYSLIDIDRDRARFRNDPGRTGSLRMVEPDRTYDTVSGIYDRICAETPGMYDRSREWWEGTVLIDTEPHRDGGGPLLRAVWEKDGRSEAYALYRIHQNWETEPLSHVQVVEAMGTTPEATREIWRFLFGIDLVDRIKAYSQPAIHPLMFMVAEPRRVRARLSDALYVRLVDVEAALQARSYARTGTLVFEIQDRFLPHNEGRWRLDVGDDGTAVGRTTDEPDLALDVSELGCVYLGGFTFAQLAAAGQIDEIHPGAAFDADGIFRTPREPWCPQVF